MTEQWPALSIPASTNNDYNKDLIKDHIGVDMELLYTNASVSISELKKNPTAVIDEADGFPVAVLNHNKPAAYLVPAAAFEAMMEKLDDIELAKLVKERENQPTIRVDPDDL
jgi:antitoxin StbD